MVNKIATYISSTALQQHKQSKYLNNSIYYNNNEKELNIMYQENMEETIRLLENY